MDPLSFDPFGMSVRERARVVMDVYLYGRANPNIYIDPTGLCACNQRCTSGSWGFVDRAISGGILFGRAVGQVTYFCSGSGLRCSFSYSCKTVGIQAGVGVGISAGRVSGQGCKCPESLPKPDGLSIGGYRDAGLQFSNLPCEGGGLGYGRGLGGALVVGSQCDATGPIRCTNSL